MIWRAPCQLSEFEKSFRTIASPCDEPMEGIRDNMDNRTSATLSQYSWRSRHVWQFCRQGPTIYSVETWLSKKQKKAMYKRTWTMNLNQDTTHSWLTGNSTNQGYRPMFFNATHGGTRPCKNSAAHELQMRVSRRQQTMICSNGPYVT